MKRSVYDKQFKMSAVKLAQKQKSLSLKQPKVLGNIIDIRQTKPYMMKNKIY